MKAAIYVRVSTEEQETANQTAPLVGIASRRGDDVVRVYEEQKSAWRDGPWRTLARKQFSPFPGLIESQRREAASRPYLGVRLRHHRRGRGQSDLV